MRGVVLASVLCVACGHLGYDSVVPGDGGADGDGDSDADSDGDGDGDADLYPFGEPERLPGVSGVGDFDDDPSLTADLLEIYFKSDRGGGGDFDIWMASRATADEPFGPPTEVDELSSPAFDATPEVSSDGLRLYLSSMRVGSRGSDVYVSSRPARDQPWAEPVRVASLSTDGDEYSATTDAADVHAIVTRDVRGDGLELFEATRADAAAPWGATSSLVALSRGGWDADAHMSPNALLLIYASDREGGAGNRDLWISTRPDTSAPFSAPVQVEEIATRFQDEDPWLSPDRRVLVFSSDREGDQDLWIATR